MTNNEWYTPCNIINSLGSFDLDPCTSKSAYLINKSAKIFYTKEDDGLKCDWFGRIWLNPPYEQPYLRLFLEKMAEHDNGIALIFSKMEAKWFHDVVLNKADSMLILYDRIKFIRPNGSVGLQPRNSSLLISYGEYNTDILKKSKLKGKFVKL